MQYRKKTQSISQVSSFHLLSRRRISPFGHVAWLGDDTPVNMALRLHVDTSLSRSSDRTWRRPPGRPRNKWINQLRDDSGHSTGDLWRHSDSRGHGGATDMVAADVAIAVE